MAGERTVDRVRLALVSVPLVVVDVLLDVLQALDQGAAARRLGVAALPGLLGVHLGVVGLWAVVFALTRTCWRHRLRNVAFHVSAGAYLFLTVAAHLYQRRTGSPLDTATLGTVVHAPAVVGDIVRRSAGPGAAALLLLVVAYAALTPWLVRRVSAHLGPRPALSTGRRSPAPVAAAAVVTLVAGLAAPLVTGSGAYGRHRAVELAAGAWDEVREDARATRPVPGPSAAPATLVRTEPLAAGEAPRNLVVVVLESLRWSATSLADPALATTPFLAELAERSTVATRAYTTVPHTSKALTSIHCGIAPPVDTRLTESEPGRIPATCLPALLGQQGYGSAFFQAATDGFERRPELVANLGFGEFRGVEDLPTDGFGPANYFGYEDDVLLDPATEWMAAQDQPFALSLLTVGGHHDYVLPDTFELQRFAEDDELNLYLNTAAYYDRFLGRLFDRIDDLGIADETVVALVGDHGEGFGEHGLRQHDNTIYEEGVHVPLLVHDPGDAVGRTVDVPVTTAGTMPSVLDALGYRVDGAAAVAAPIRTAEPAPVHLSCQSVNRCLSRVDGSSKFVHHFGHRPDELFDLDADPGEQDNLLSTLSRAEQAALREDLLAWRTEVRVLWAPSTGG